MSLYDDDRYDWRETYFVLFDPERRPRTKDVHRTLIRRAGTFRVLDEQTESDGTLRSLTIASYEDHSALEIRYAEGDAVQAENAAMIETLREGSSPEEWILLKKAAQCRARFEVMHFEQTAGTAAFNIVKMPDISFAPRKPSDISKRYRNQDAFPKQQHCDKLGDSLTSSNNGRTPRFHFDPDSYENCRSDGAALNDSDDSIFDPNEDSGIIERIDPNTLVLVLEVLCRASGGIAIDPASGMVI